jgi:PAS domain S-box-containing protein
MSLLGFALGYISVYVIAVLALADYPLGRAWLGTVAQLGAALAPIAVVVNRRHHWIGCQRLFWQTIATGMAVWCVGHFGWAYGTFVEGRAQWVGWHTVFSFCGAAAPVIALFAWPHLGIRRNAYATTAVDVAALGAVTGFMVAYFILIPNIDPAMAAFGLPSVLVTAQVQRVLMFAGMVGAAIMAHGLPWHRTYLRLAGAIGLGVLLRLVLNAALAMDIYEPGHLYDLAWIVPYLGYAWAASEAPSSPAEEPEAMRRQAAHPWVITTAFATVATIGYGVHLAWPMSATVDATRVLFTTLTVVLGLALVTIRMIVQRAELQRVDQRMRLLAAVSAHTQDLVCVVNAGGIIEEVNEAFLSHTGFEASELKARRSVEFLSADSVETLPALREAVARDGVWRGTLTRLKKDGRTFPVAVTVTSLRDAGDRVTHLIGIERDISDELKMREQLIHTERLAATSEVVAGVAHEINNPLQAILGCTELLLDGVQGQTRSDLEIVRSEAVRAGQIVRNLLAFVHRGPGQRQVVDLNELVQSLVALRSYALAQNGIRIDLACHPAPLPASVNQEEIRQVLLNLVLNAEQAISGTGRQDGRIAVRTSLSAHHAVLEIEDDGPGVPAEHRARMFEPFFTTKQVGQGTGLGLSISLGIALSHGGTLEYEAAPTGGAIFRLTLPALGSPDGGKARSTPHAAPASSAAPTAFVVEDDSAIRGLLERLLMRKGYRVIQASNGEEAIRELAAMRQALPDIIMCDVRMPRMSGTEFYREAVGAHPAVARRFVLMTGDSARGDAAEFAASVKVPLLRKPFSAADLDVALLELKEQSLT